MVQLDGRERKRSQLRQKETEAAISSQYRLRSLKHEENLDILKGMYESERHGKHDDDNNGRRG